MQLAIDRRPMMRDSAEIMSMLTIHGITIGHIPGGTPDLVALDVAGAMGMSLTPLQADMLLAKYAHDAGSYRSARVRWFVRICDEARAKRWARGKHGTLKAMADYTLAEWIDFQRCRVCRGVGAQVTAESKVGACLRCDGTGNEPISDRAAARGLGLSAEAYRTGFWRDRVAWCRRELTRIEIDARRELGLALTT